MWYRGFAPTNHRTLYAESSDGITWNNFQLALNNNVSGIGYDSRHSQDCKVIKDGSVFKMWYTGYDVDEMPRILYAESIDGINWSNFQLVVDTNASETGYDNHSMSPEVIKDNGLFKMWYSGYRDGDTSRILYAERP